MPLRAGVTFSKSDKIAPYEEALRLAGFEPLRCSAEACLSLNDMDALVLTGGSDVNPARYGEAVHPETEEPEDERDQMEIQLVRQALKRDLPVLAICRGLQLLNVVQGGTLIQHLEGHVARTPDAGKPAHTVNVVPQSKLAAIVGPGILAVNSRHHQAIARLGEGLTVTARAEGDGTIEAVEMPAQRFVIAVQWHPENQAPKDARQLSLFQALATAVVNGSARY